MLSRRLNAVLGLPNTQLEKSTTQFMGAGGRGKRLFMRFVLCSSLMLGVLISISFFAPTSASHRDASLMLNSMTGRVALGSSSFLVTETVETLATDCTTAKSTYVLGDTVCAQVNGAPLPFLGFRQRRFQWVDPSGSVVQQTDITTDPQDDTFTVPTTGPLAQVGTWTVRTIKNNGSTVAITRFVVSDPANLRADLSVGKFGQLEVKSGNNAIYTISVVNRGPDDAQNVQLTDAVPSNMTFVSDTQTSGPAFNCTDPTMGGTGTITCTRATLMKDETASFTFVFMVDTGTPNGTSIDNTASATSSTVELFPANNSSTVLVTVTGASGGGSECVITPPSDITVPHDPNQPSAIVNYPPPTTTGASCGAVSCSQGSGTAFPIGTTTVVCFGETGDAASFNVTVTDTVNPTISCPLNQTAAEDTPGSGFATVTYSDPAASDDSGSVAVTCDHDSGSSFPVGTTTVRCTATDPANNTASCTFTVSVSGTACALTCPSNISVDADAGQCGAIVDYPDPSANACGTVASSPASGTFFDIGTTTVHVTTSAGQSCSFTITVKEHTPPTVVTPSPVTAVADANCQAAIPDFVTDLNASDNCSDGDFLTITQNLAAGTVVGAGPHTVVITVTDASNNSTTVNATFTVTDAAPPVITLNGANPITVECHTSFTDPGATAHDTCAGNFAATASSNVNVNAPGTYTITYTASDPSGNAATPVTRTVNVVDTISPVITLNGANPMTVECHTTFTDPGATAADSCAGSRPVTATGTVNANVPGTYTITYSASDGNGHTTTTTRTVNVLDNTPPTISCQSDILVEFNPAVGGADVTYTPPVGSDSCAGSLAAAQLTGLPSGATFPLGKTTNTFRVTDGAGLTATCSFKVTVALTSIIGLNSVTISGAGPIDSYDSNGSYPATKSSLANVVSNGTITMTGSAKVWGNVRSTRVGVVMSGATQVTGNATAGTTVSRSGSASVGGTITNNALAPVMVLPAVPVCGPPYSSNSGISGTYSYNASTGDLSLSGVNIATLANGNYCFHNVTVGGSSQLKVNGAVTIKLTGTLNTSGAASLNNTTLIPSNLRILSSYTGSNGVNFSNSASAYLMVYAPGTNVTISGASPLFGTVMGKTLTVSNSGMLHYDVRLKTIWPSLWPLIVGP